MAFTPITGTVPQYSTADNELASGYYLKFYLAGTTTPLSVATDGTGSTLLAKIKLNPRGLPITNPLDDDTVFIPHVDQAYRIVLYKSEADADANNTANAEFNIASVAPDVAPSADAADITLRTNNLEAWDDYDRSPLFVDGTDFTAGAGPHVITVPADWDPTDADFRIWKLDAPADTVIALTATTETSTTFTLAETLLSTDVIFIGDDQFRNIHDGDPDDIKARLTLSDALLASNNLSELDSAATSRTNLGLGDSATRDVGLLSTEVPQGDVVPAFYLPYQQNVEAFDLNIADTLITLTGTTYEDVAIVGQKSGVPSLGTRDRYHFKIASVHYSSTDDSFQVYDVATNVTFQNGQFQHPVDDQDINSVAVFGSMGTASNAEFQLVATTFGGRDAFKLQGRLNTAVLTADQRFLKIMSVEKI